MARATVQVIDNTIQEALARIPNDRRALSLPTPPAATNDASVDGNYMTAHAGDNSADEDDVPDTDANLAEGKCTADPTVHSAPVPTRGLPVNVSYVPNCGVSDNPRVGFHHFWSQSQENYDTRSRDNAPYVTPGHDPAF